MGAPLWSYTIPSKAARRSGLPPAALLGPGRHSSRRCHAPPCWLKPLFRRSAYKEEDRSSLSRKPKEAGKRLVSSITGGCPQSAGGRFPAPFLRVRVQAFHVLGGGPLPGKVDQAGACRAAHDAAASWKLVIWFQIPLDTRHRHIGALALVANEQPIPHQVGERLAHRDAAD